ncbi:MAG: cytochrome C, partial [Desulfuromonadales bacterium]|nr:cytochrome C [Desulfuromonadales bacterium]
MLLLLLAPSSMAWAEECTVCHLVTVRGAHATVACGDCHGADGQRRRLAGEMAAGCTACHPGMQGVMQGPMALRASEREFAAAAFGRRDRNFFEKNCNSCHLAGCLDCHGDDGHAIARPQKEDCHACHRGYFVGADYWGMAPREDHLRYQRGAGFDGEKYLK